MPAVMEAIDRMSPDERVKTMEYLWAAMTAAAEPESPAWHGDILAERRRRVAAGEESFMRQLQNPAKLVGRIAPNPPRRVEGNAPYQVLQLPLMSVAESKRRLYEEVHAR